MLPGQNRHQDFIDLIRKDYLTVSRTNCKSKFSVFPLHPSYKSFTIFNSLFFSSPCILTVSFPKSYSFIFSSPPINKEIIYLTDETGCPILLFFKDRQRNPCQKAPQAPPLPSHPHLVILGVRKTRHVSGPATVLA